MPRLLFIWNPTSRKLRPDCLEPAVGVVREAGWQVELQRTGWATHAVDLAREAANDGFDVVAACGGDGTVNEVVNGLAGSRTALAVIPGGTANVWAKEIGLPLDPLLAARLVVEGERRAVDVGRAGDRRFLLMAGVGFDAHVVERMTPGLKRRLGAASFIALGARELLRYREAPEELTVDDRTVSTPVFWLLLGNTRSYGGAISITNRALVDDGQLDVCVLQHAGVLRFARYGLPMLLGRLNGARGVLWERARTLEVEGVSLPVQVDGEPAGRTPMRFDVEPGALLAIVPPGCRSALFTRGSKL